MMGLIKKKKSSLLLIFLTLSLFVFASFFYSSISHAENKKELGITYETDARIDFSGFNNIYLTFNVKRLFLNEIEYHYVIKGELKWDDDMEMYTFRPNLSDCKLIKSPFSSSEIPMQNIYGVFKLLNEKSDEEFIISILRDSENNDRIPAPKIRELMLPIEIPEDAIIVESEHNNNFTHPEIEYNYEDIYERKAYIPFKLFNYLQAQNIKYEVFYTLDGEYSGIDMNGNPFTSTLYQALYSQNPDYRLAKVIQRSEVDTLFAEDDLTWTDFFIDPNNMWMQYKPNLTETSFSVIEDPNMRDIMIEFWQRDSILKRVSLVDEHIDKFQNLSAEVPLSDISGVSIETANHQISMSGKPSNDANEAKITFLAVYKDPNPEIDRWIDVSKFEATNTKDKTDFKTGVSIQGPPLLLSWEIFPYKNVDIEIKNGEEIIYQGNDSQVKDYLVSNFSPGEYSLKMSNSLGSKMVSSIFVDPPGDSLEVFKVTYIDDEFETEEKLEKINSKVTFNKLNPQMEIAINVLGNPPEEITVNPYQINQNNSLLIQENIEKRKDIYEGYFTQYRYDLIQINEDLNDTDITVSTNDLEKTFRADLSKKLKERKNTAKKQNFTNTTNNDKEWSVFFDNPYADIMVFKTGTTEESFSNVKNEMLQQTLLSEFVKSEAKKKAVSDKLSVISKHTHTADDETDKGFIGKVLGVSFSRKITKEEKNKSFVLLGIFMVVSLSLGIYLFKKK